MTAIQAERTALGFAESNVAEEVPAAAANELACLATEDEQVSSETPVPQVVRPLRRTSAAGPVLALTALGAALAGGLLARKFLGKKKKSSTQPQQLQSSTTDVPIPAPCAASVAPDLSPFGSPVVGTPNKLGNTNQPDADEPKLEDAAEAPVQGAASDVADDASDSASVRDQRTAAGLADAAQVQKALKQMQEMQEENRKLQAFLSEYKADADKLSRLEGENAALRSVTARLEGELRELRDAATLPRTGAELESFKSAVRLASTTRSVCSNDDTIVPEGGTASVDGANMEASRRRSTMLKQLLGNLMGSAWTTPASSTPATPRAGGGGSAAAGAAPGAVAARSGRKAAAGPGPGPSAEDTAAVGQAVFALLDTFGGRMM